MSRFRRWTLAVWTILTFGWLSFELWMVLDGDPTTPAFTDLIGQIPPGWRWAVIFGLGGLVWWLGAWHFPKRWEEKDRTGR